MIDDCSQDHCCSNCRRNFLAEIECLEKTVEKQKKILRDVANELLGAPSCFDPNDDCLSSLAEIARETIFGAEEQGAAWAIQWFWDRGLRHHGAYSNAICAEARTKK